jgi:hypothetical protein
VVPLAEQLEAEEARAAAEEEARRAAEQPLTSHVAADLAAAWQVRVELLDGWSAGMQHCGGGAVGAARLRLTYQHQALHTRPRACCPPPQALEDSYTHAVTGSVWALHQARLAALRHLAASQQQFAAFVRRPDGCKQQLVEQLVCRFNAVEPDLRGSRCGRGMGSRLAMPACLRSPVTSS